MQVRRSILIAGASSDIGLSLINQLRSDDCLIGAHCYKGGSRLRTSLKAHDVPRAKYEVFTNCLDSQTSCHELVDAFVSWAGGGPSALVHLVGNVSRVCEWEHLDEASWQSDISINLSSAFFTAQRAFHYMKETGGKILMTSTASASHGGGAQTLSYGIAKAGVESLTKGLARSGAPYGILVNAIAPGLIDTRFHTDRLGRSPEMIKKRAELVPLKRAGHPEEVARMINFLLSSGGDFITGEVISISGGDWL